MEVEKIILEKENIKLVKWKNLAPKIFIHASTLEVIFTINVTPFI